jgi:rfaE bifunctional protein kinase chain/domain
VIGDVCLDEYLVGRAARLSREAPVPVLEFVRRETVPGGAANPARNIRALGGEPVLVSVVGDDEAGEALCRQLKAEGVDVSGVVVDATRATVVKTRVLAEVSLRFPQQVARIDRQDRTPLGPSAADSLARRLSDLAACTDALLVSDYQSGVVTADLAAAASREAHRRSLLATVDTQGSLLKFRGYSVVKANQPDTESCLGIKLGDEESFERAGRDLLQRLDAQSVVITRASDGMSLIEPDRYTHLRAANRTDVFDTTGAGDTVIAVLTQAMAAGAGLDAAGALANAAAGLVVRKLGNATVSPDELASAIRRA